MASLKIRRHLCSYSLSCFGSVAVRFRLRAMEIGAGFRPNLLLICAPRPNNGTVLERIRCPGFPLVRASAENRSQQNKIFISFVFINSLEIRRESGTATW